MSEHRVSKAEAARLLGISVRTVERRLRDGTLTAATVYGPHGPERRIVLPPPPVTPDTDDPGEGFAAPTEAPPPAAPPSPVALSADVAGLVVPLVAASGDTDTALRLLVAALGEARRENSALSYRLGQAEARLRAESPVRDTAARPGRLQRLWGALWGRGGQ